jgi:hypothetical protein
MPELVTRTAALRRDGSDPEIVRAGERAVSLAEAKNRFSAMREMLGGQAVP